MPEYFRNTIVQSYATRSDETIAIYVEHPMNVKIEKSAFEELINIYAIQ